MKENISNFPQKVYIPRDPEWYVKQTRNKREDNKIFC